eukprot:7569790-Alexandrium_andersonii.AAC.1
MLSHVPEEAPPPWRHGPHLGVVASAAHPCNSLRALASRFAATSNALQSHLRLSTAAAPHCR